MNLLIFPLTGTPNALFHATYKILASRGGRNPTSTGSGFGGSIKKRGLAPAPFLFCPRTPRFPGADLLVPLSILSVGDCYHDSVLDVAPAHASKSPVKKMSRQWGHWRLGRGGWRALHWSSISRAFTPHFLAHWYLGRAQQHQHCADRKDCQNHSNLQPRLPRTQSVSFQRTPLSLARPAHFHRYSPLPLVPLAVVPLYHRRQ